MTHFHGSENLLTGLCAAEYFRGTLWRSQLSLLRYHTHLCPLHFISERIPRLTSHKSRSDYTQWPEKPACFRELRPTNSISAKFHFILLLSRVVHADDAAHIFRLYFWSNQILKAEIYRLRCQQNAVFILGDGQLPMCELKCFHKAGGGREDTRLWNTQRCQKQNSHFNYKYFWIESLKWKNEFQIPFHLPNNICLHSTA